MNSTNNNEEWFQLHSLDDDKLPYDHDVGHVEVKLSYDLEYLYITLRSQQYGIINRDRAYQNGDGFHFVLSKTDKCPATEFFVIAVNPLNKQKPVFVWYRNMDLEHYYLEKAAVEIMQLETYQYYSVKLKWSELEWCNPVLTQSFGFNISYVKAMENGDSYTYILKDDEYIQSEEKSREFIRIDLSEIQDEKTFRINCVLKSKNIKFGEQPTLKIMSSKHEKVPISAKIEIDGKYTITENIEVCNISQSRKIQLGSDFIKKSFNKIIEKHTLKVQVYLKGEIIHSYEDWFSILNENFIEVMKLQLKQIQCQDKLGKASKDTLEYEIENIEHMMKKLHNYELGDNIMVATEQFNGKMELMNKPGYLFIQGESRYAFVSKYDGTLQPYTMYLPRTIDENTRILIYLHGSGADDRSAFSKKVWATLSEKCNIVLLAPHGRGVSNCYCPVETRADIGQLIRHCRELFRIQNEQVILSGFSMGGYGVLRVYHGMENIFHKLLMLSGSPDLGAEWECPLGIDYTEDDKINIFKSPEIMVIHSKNDLNCPYNIMKKFVQKLQNVNDKVTFIIDDKAGHSSMREEILPDLVKFIGAKE